MDLIESDDLRAALENASREAEALVNTIERQGGNLDPVYDALEVSVRRFEEAGYPIESIVPGGDEAGLGFSLKKWTSSGRDFYRAYKKAIKKDLCKPHGDLHKLAKAGLSGGTGAVVAVIFQSLALPPAALGFVVPFAAVIVSKGLDAFCSLED